METLKFLMVNSFYPPYHYGGADVQVYFLANELAKMGHEVHTVHCIDSYYLKRKEEPNEDYPNNENVHVHAIKSSVGAISPISSFVTGIPFFKSKLQEIMRENFDVIHYHNISFLGQKVMELGDGIKVYTEHTNWLVCPRGTLTIGCQFDKNCLLCMLKSKKVPQIWRYTGLLDRSLKDIKTIIAPSVFVKNILIQGRIKTPITVIPNFAPDPPQNIEDSKYSKYFLYAGVLERHKGILDLLEFFNKYHKEIGIKLIIAGGGSLETHIKRFISSNNLDRYIKYIGWSDRNSLYSLYKDASALIIPSSGAENAPIVALESLSVGIPIVVSNVGGLSEIANNINKSLVYNNDIELKNLLVNFKKEDYSLKVKEAYEKYYTIRSYCNRYFEVLK
ncbi:glycosyltransferase family 4 protein [candidate division WOR-3 bacterium]|nr:glycosyltransferase family 4 protein [candidate division WOR-3 bacterium]